MNAADRRALAIKAIEAVNRGALAADVETDVVDFKEEKGTIGRDGRRISIQPRDEAAAAALAGEAACMSNSLNGGILIVGVNDEERGQDAFVDTYLDFDWLRRRIHELTVPHLSVDEIEEYPVQGKRVYLVNVHAGLEEVRVNGVLRGRRNRECVELTGDDARRFLEERRNFDWSADKSRVRLSHADPDAVEEAMRLYGDVNERRAPSSLELVRRLGVVGDESPDPVLTQAGGLLLCRPKGASPLITLIVTDVEGSRSRVHEDLSAPLVLAFRAAWRTIDAAFPSSSVVVGAYRRTVRAIPEPVLREALVNALMHRDYRHDRSAVVALATGVPATTLKVTSPGGFPSGVDGDRLLVMRSRPRNQALSSAMRLLGMGETEGIGVDTMYVAMLRDGHAAPEIVETGGDVVCRLSGGGVDLAVRRFFDGLYKTDPMLEDDARVHIAVMELLRRPTLRAEWLTNPAQCTTGEANDVLDRLFAVGVLERLLDGSRSFRLTREARDGLRPRISYSTRLPFDNQWETIRALYDVRKEISSSDVSTALDYKSNNAATQVLKKAKGLGLIAAQGGRELGRGVRYTLTDEGRNYRL